MNTNPQTQYPTVSISKKTDKSKPINVNTTHEEALSFGDRFADKVAATIGSWNFIISQSIVLTLWILLNSIAWTLHWDNYPYILLNLMLSFQAAYSAPIIMMAQNRQAQKDRLTAERDYQVDLKSEQDILALMQHLDQQDHELERKMNMVLSAIDRIGVSAHE